MSPRVQLGTIEPSLMVPFRLNRNEQSSVISHASFVTLFLSHLEAARKGDYFLGELIQLTSHLVSA